MKHREIKRNTVKSTRQLAKYSYLIIMKATIILLSSFIMGCLCIPKNDLTCSICVDVVTDIDNFITSDTTEQEIVDFVKEVKSSSTYSPLCQYFFRYVSPWGPSFLQTFTLISSVLTWWRSSFLVLLKDWWRTI